MQNNSKKIAEYCTKHSLHHGCKYSSCTPCVQDNKSIKEKTQTELEKELFDIVYQWGRVGLVTDEKAPTFQDLISQITAVAIHDNRRHGTT